MRLDLQSRRGSAARNPEDSIKSINARQFYLQAAEALKKGQIMQAELCIKVALGHERNNEAIRSLFGQIQIAKTKK
jgi:hypothetical protein